MTTPIEPAVAAVDADLHAFVRGYEPDWSVGSFDDVRAAFLAQVARSHSEVDVDGIAQLDSILAFDWK